MKMVSRRWKNEFLVHQMLIQIKVRETLENNEYTGHIVSSPKVLVIEDDKIVQCFIRHHFQALGCEVLIAENASRAFELYNPSIHLVLIDLDLPDLPGVTVANWIRRQEMGTDQHIPIIGHTSLLTEENEYRCFVAGMDTAIEKLQNQQECQSLLKVWLPEFMKVN